MHVVSLIKYRGNIIDVDFQKLSFPVGNLLLQVQPWLAISLMYLDQIRICGLLRIK